MTKNPKGLCCVILISRSKGSTSAFEDYSKQNLQKFGDKNGHCENTSESTKRIMTDFVQLGFKEKW